MKKKLFILLERMFNIKIIPIQEYENNVEQSKNIKAALMKASSDALYFGQEYAKLKKSIEEKELELLPSTNVSFDKTVENFKSLTSRAKTTLLFRITQVLSSKEKESLNNYLNFEASTKRKKASNRVTQ